MRCHSRRKFPGGFPQILVLPQIAHGRADRRRVAKVLPIRGNLLLPSSAIQQHDGPAAVFELLRPDFKVSVLGDPLSLAPERILVHGNHFLVGENVVNRRAHAAQIISRQQRHFQHVRIVPVSRAGVRLQPNLLVKNGEHAIGAATAIRPLLLSSPSILDIACSPPQVSAYFLAPQPGFGGAPFADAEHNRTPRGVERGANIGIRCPRVLSSGVAPVVLQVVHAPGGVLDCVLILVPESPRASRASFRACVRVDPELQPQRMNVVADGLHSMRKALRIGNDVSARIPAHLPAIVDVDVHVSGIFHARLYHRVGHSLDHVFADVAGELVPRVPSHWRRERQIGRWRGTHLREHRGSKHQHEQRYGKKKMVRFHGHRFTRSDRRLVPEGERLGAHAPDCIYNAAGHRAHRGATFMRRLQLLFTVATLSWCLAISTVRIWAQNPAAVGTFEDHTDVGTVLHPGSVNYDPTTKTYTITGSGENMWSVADAFQFVWKKMSGDVSLTADISFLTKTGNEHKKAVLMLRQSLDADSVYADVVLHLSGLTSLQFRDEKGAVTHEIESNISGPKRLRIVKRGDYVYMGLPTDGADLKPAGGWLRIPLGSTFYVGLGVCSHDKDVSEQALFSKVELSQLSTPSGQPTLYSVLEVVNADSTAIRRVHYLSEGRFEAPNWTHDGGAFLFNRNGHIERLTIGGDNPTIIPTGFADRCNNDHGISPDSTQLAISDNSQGDHESRVYLVPIAGGTPHRITEKAPSYWHGWSPDGKTLAFVGQRNGDFDIYSIPAAGGEETRLTTAKGLDDGPEYSPDGKYIYFNSERTGHMQIWRMKPDGSEQEQVFSDDLNNWFPHISPDGQWMAFLTYDADVSGHPENKNVMLRLMSLSDKKITVLARLFGGQGTINVPSWSPDSKQLAFVSYMLIPPEDSARQ